MEVSHLRCPVGTNKQMGNGSSPAYPCIPPFTGGLLSGSVIADLNQRLHGCALHIDGGCLSAAPSGCSTADGQRFESASFLSPVQRVFHLVFLLHPNQRLRRCPKDIDGGFSSAARSARNTAGGKRFESFCHPLWVVFNWCSYLNRISLPFIGNAHRWRLPIRGAQGAQYSGWTTVRVKLITTKTPNFQIESFWIFIFRAAV